MKKAVQKAEQQALPPLSEREIGVKKQLEETIFKNFKAFYDVGLALAEIQERRLYRPHKTFEAYCKETFALAKSRAYQLIKAAEVYEEIKTIDYVEKSEDGNDVHKSGDLLLPVNEAQLRPLLMLPDSQRKAAWQIAISTLPAGKKITAGHVNKTAKGMLGELTEKGVEKIRDETRRAERIDPQIKELFESFLNQVAIANQDGWRTTDRRVVLQMVQALGKTIANGQDPDEAAA